jgi:hypothetical protein
MDLFEKPIRSKKVRNNIYAHQYKNGIININSIKFVMHSMTSAIKTFRKKTIKTKQNVRKTN